MNRARFVLAAGLAVAFSFAPRAYAQATRTWVSGVGDDANPCSRTAPCKTFAGAISKTAIAGEINTLDPGGFGTVTITKSITIDATAGLGGVLAAGTNGIIVNATGPNDVVILRNLDLNGAGNGLMGVRIIAARDVYVENTKIYGFTGRAISEERLAGRLFVSDTVISDNAATAIGLAPTSASTLTFTGERLRLAGNGNAGLVVSQGIRATLSNSVVSGNAYGHYVSGSGSELNLEGVITTVNTTGVSSLPGAVVRLSNTTVTGNGTGLSAGGGNIYSYGTNRIDGNGAGNGPATALGLQ